jgi:hypothetical protein
MEREWKRERKRKRGGDSARDRRPRQREEAGRESTCNGSSRNGCYRTGGAGMAATFGKLCAACMVPARTGSCAGRRRSEGGDWLGDISVLMTGLGGRAACGRKRTLGIRLRAANSCVDEARAGRRRRSGIGG